MDERDLRIVDVRSKFDFDKGHIRNAINIQLGNLIRSHEGLPAMCAPYDEIAQMLSRNGIGDDTTVVAYDNFGGVLASRLVWTLELLGHGSVGIFDGSVKRWLDAGEAFTKDVIVPKSEAFSVRSNLSRLATKEWIQEHLKDPQVGFLDVRQKNEYLGRTAFGSRGGHIPGAVNVHWLENIDPTTCGLRGRDELKKMYIEKGLTPDKDIISYCWMGLRASFGYMVLRSLGYEKVRMYDASFAEWGEGAMLPLEAGE
jgi:thiosulfate/3-mercaptopyruvate sulfurtransferase